jgi:proline dehydrogenase
MNDPVPAPLSFADTAAAFAYKTDAELKRAHWLFSLMQYNGLVNIATRLTPWAIRNHLPIQSILRKTLFPQFVGGEDLQATAKVAEKLGRYHVQVILDYGVEGGDNSDAEYDAACEQFIQVIRYAATQSNIPFMSVKVTGISRFGLLEKLNHSVEVNSGTLMKRYEAALQSLSSDERAEWDRVLHRLDRICSEASQKKVGVFIDAEDTWIQDPVDVATILMMERYNQSVPVVYNTYQLYRHDRLQFLRDCFEASVQRNFILGAKLVRGAYMEKERERAQRLNYPSPIQPDKASTDRDYDAAILYCIEHIDRIALVVASHNDHSNLYTTQLMDQRGIAHHHPHVHFSQLYGMSDHITFNLAHAGFSVSKYLPYGPIDEVVHYLMRRAQENSSVGGQTGRELTLIRKELQRRGL